MSQTAFVIGALEAARKIYHAHLKHLDTPANPWRMSGPVAKRIIFMLSQAYSEGVRSEQQGRFPGISRSRKPYTRRTVKK